MNVTLAQIYNSQESLKNIISLALPARISYKLSKLASLLEIEFKAIEKSRMDLIQKYGFQDKNNPDIWQVSMNNFPEFDKQLQTFLKEETNIEINMIEIKIEEIKDTKIKTQDMILLEPFINFVE